MTATSPMRWVPAPPDGVVWAAAAMPRETTPQRTAAASTIHAKRQKMRQRRAARCSRTGWGLRPGWPR